MTTKIKDRTTAKTVAAAAAAASSKSTSKSTSAVPLLMGFLGLGALAALASTPSEKKEEKAPASKLYTVTKTYGVDGDHTTLSFRNLEGQAIAHLYGSYHNGHWSIPCIYQGPDLNEAIKRLMNYPVISPSDVEKAIACGLTPEAVAREMLNIWKDIGSRSDSQAN